MVVSCWFPHLKGNSDGSGEGEGEKILEEALLRGFEAVFWGVGARWGDHKKSR